MVVLFLWSLPVFSQTTDAPKDSDIRNPQAPISNPPGAVGPGNTAVYKPYTISEKFVRRTRGVFGVVPLVIVGASAGIAQYSNTPSEWGQGAEGYGRRFGNAFGVNFANQYFGFALESMLHQDPRYFPSLDRSVKGRVFSVIRQTFIARQDNGSEGFAVAKLGSAFGAGLLANTWNPRSESHVGDGLKRGGVIIAANAGINLAQEFVPFFRRRRP